MTLVNMTLYFVIKRHHICQEYFAFSFHSHDHIIIWTIMDYFYQKDYGERNYCYF